MRKKLSVVLIKDKESDTWSAHCLEYAIFGQTEPGADWEKALKVFEFMTLAHIDHDLYYNKKPFSRKSAAPKEFHDMWHSGESVGWHTFEVPETEKSEGIHIDCTVVKATYYLDKIAK